MGDIVRTAQEGTLKSGVTVKEDGVASFFSGVKEETLARAETISFTEGKLSDETLTRAETVIITNL
ncbi:hypothetical protein MUP46_01175 [Patescibacteria group bacterium]|nr:hypothetical protein [Patescibacteria group bacterium]